MKICSQIRGGLVIFIAILSELVLSCAGEPFALFRWTGYPGAIPCNWFGHAVAAVFGRVFATGSTESVTAGVRTGDL